VRCKAWRRTEAKALPLIRARTAYGTPDVERDTAIGALAQLAATLHRPKAATPLLVQIIGHDPLVSSRAAAAGALGMLGDEAALPALESAEHDDPDILVRLAAWDSILSIRNAVAAREFKAQHAKT
jgi:HEAT repeat protein